MRKLSCVFLLGVVGLVTWVGCQDPQTDPGTTDSGNSAGTEPGGNNGRRAFLSMGTAPVGGAFAVVGGTIAEVLNANRGDNDWKVQAKGTKGSQENIRRLAQGEIQLALSNSAISYFAVRGEASWKEKYDLRAVATLAPNVAMFIAPKESGIEKIIDLVGKRVSVGPAGAGFEMFVSPLLEVHAVSYDDFTQINATQSAAVEQLGDGAADAAFLGGAVPTASIIQACSTMQIHFVPFEAEARDRLVEKYPFFQPITVPKEKYSDLEEDFQGLNVGSMHLISYANQDEELIYQLTKTLWENREAVVKGHPAGKAINEKNVARYTGTPFHPGAIRFYKEIGVWPEDAPAEAVPAVEAADPAADDETPAAEVSEGEDVDAAADQPAETP